ncbi:MAG: c-type cytochrome [Sulfuricurvum sp.]|uniref:c-type cytochrome n=1 Tax=Sulfuricurvum sp. TaxID=2025608 RepID=UPI00261DD8C8|nr:c-type cytochrome [Sulfuricurvum sp.]MDD2828116.1 c-type cytochrome [Sulfuricurvum sp.]MDD4948010.1 c-type cytochrome [Sulfuricurvum sp.]
MSSLSHQLSIFLMSLYVVTTPLSADTSGEALFKEKCSHCHLETRPSYDKINTMIAPPMMGVLFHVQQSKPTKPEAVAFISDYIINPHLSKSLCQESSIKKFGLMPSLKENLTPKEANTVAEYVYERFANKNE